MQIPPLPFRYASPFIWCFLLIILVASQKKSFDNPILYTGEVDLVDGGLAGQPDKLLDIRAVNKRQVDGACDKELIR